MGQPLLPASRRRRADLALIGVIEESAAAIDRAVDLLMLFDSTIVDLPKDLQGYAARILTYNQEGDGIVLNHLVGAYELARERMTPPHAAGSNATFSSGSSRR